MGFQNVNLDLMYGFPGHSLSSWEQSLDTTINLRPAHISCYAFTVEEGSNIYEKIHAGEVSEPEETLQNRLANPFETLTVTFTNKAASEMKQRVEEMLKIGTDGWWIGTFHAMGARILRKHPELVGLKRQFSIIDIDDLQC